MQSHGTGRWRWMFAALFAAFALLLAACGDDDDDGDAATDTTDEESTDTTEDEATDETVAGDEAFELTVELEPLNDSGASGEATITSSEPGTIDVSIATDGVTPGQPHAQHLHVGGDSECPDPALAGDDDLITTAEGVPAYGEVALALTTEGDVSADSALAVERFPVANEEGTVAYERTIELPDGVTADDVLSSVVVQHGLGSLSGDESAYDGDAESSLDPSLPLEATLPILCGVASS